MSIQAHSSEPWRHGRFDSRDPTSSKSAAPGILFQPTDDRYTAPSAPTSSPDLPSETQKTILAPHPDPPDQPIRVELRSPSGYRDPALKPTITHLAPRFVKPSFQPIGRRKVLRIPADGSPSHEVSLEILETASHPGEPPVRFPDMREYFTAASMSQIDCQVLRTNPDEPQEASIGTYIMFKNRSKEALQPNQHFQRGHVWGDVFIAKVVENATVYWSDEASEGFMYREVWNKGVVGVMYYHIPFELIGVPVFQPGKEKRLEFSTFLREILALKPVEHHDAVDLGLKRGQERRAELIDDLLVITSDEETADGKNAEEDGRYDTGKGKERTSPGDQVHNHVRFQEEHDRDNVEKFKRGMKTKRINELIREERSVPVNVIDKGKQKGALTNGHSDENGSSSSDRLLFKKQNVLPNGFSNGKREVLFTNGHSDDNSSTSDNGLLQEEHDAPSNGFSSGKQSILTNGTNNGDPPLNDKTNQTATKSPNHTQPEPKNPPDDGLDDLLGRRMDRMDPERVQGEWRKLERNGGSLGSGPGSG